MESANPQRAERPSSAAASFGRRLIHLDAAVSLSLHRLAQPFPRPLLLALELSGDGRFFFPAVLSFLLLPLSSSSSAAAIRPFITALLAGGLLDLLLVGLAKHLVRRPRPVYNKGMSLAFAVDHWSFPSGHSSRVCFIACFLRLASASVETAFRDYGKNAGPFLPVVAFWAAATSISRVLLGRHFVFDVLAGACLGVFEALAVFYFRNAFDSQLRQYLLL